jgi:filamentous hemagglutinin family protein
VTDAARTAPTALIIHPARARRLRFRKALLHGVSIGAMLVSAHARAGGPFRTLGQALSAQANVAVTAAATQGGAIAAQQAGLGTQNVARAAATFRTLSEALAGLTTSGDPIPDGVQPGGLQQAPGIAGGPNTEQWSGASTTLTQTVVGGITDVTVNQTQNVANLTWQSFNIGTKTKLIYSQSSNGTAQSNWVAINTVDDPSANPATILGQISAPGKIFILDSNGILFGAGAQVNVGALVASTAAIAQAQLTTDVNGFVNSVSLYGTVSGNTFSSSFTNATAAVTVEPGAVITTPAAGAGETGGYVMLLGASVYNGGLISTPGGQTILSAGNNFQLQPGYSDTNVIATVIGSEIASTFNGSITGTGTTQLGAVTNAGIILSDQGDITLNGHAITQEGVLLSTTTVDNRGTVHLLTDNSDATASIVFAPGSVTEVLPEDNGDLALNSVRNSDISTSATNNTTRRGYNGAELNDFNTLADTLGESRIEISTGGSVDMQENSLALAQGGQVMVNAAQSIVLESGATIDVSGTNATLPAAANSLYIQGIVPYYERDSAGNRVAGGIEFANVYIDERTLVEITTGSYGTNSPVYTAGGLLEVSGNLGLIGHGINEWTSVAGTVALQSGTGSSTTGGTVVVSSGATINLTGGTTTYQAGEVPQSYVQAVGGRVYNINYAPGDLVYTGVYTGEAETHPRWHYTENFVNPLLTPSEIYESQYTIGHDAGSLIVTAGDGEIDGLIAAGVTVGQSQIVAQPSSVTDPFQLPQSAVPLAGTLEVGNYYGGVLNPGIFYQTTIDLGTTTPGNRNNGSQENGGDTTATGTISIASDALSADGFSVITLSTGGTIMTTDVVSVAGGGTLTLSGQDVQVGADILAPGGSIVLTNLAPGSTNGTIASTSGTIGVAPGVTLYAAGQWTNLELDPNSYVGAGLNNGGSVKLLGTGGVDLPAGSVIDVSSGGVLGQNNKLTSANGGNVTISADLLPVSGGFTIESDAVVLEAAILGYGSGGAGTLTIAAPSVDVGGSTPASTSEVVINQPLFADGFASYVLNGFNGLTVEPGTDLVVARPIYALTYDTTAPTGTAPADVYSVVMPALFAPVKGDDSISQRAGASITLSSSINPSVYDGGGGTVTIGAGASITVDPKQSITVDGYGQVTDYGTLTAHGGTVTVANTRYEETIADSGNDNASNFIAGLSVWIADGALIDVSGEAAVFTDSLGRSFGQAGNGGDILLGGLGGLNQSSPESTYAQVIVRPGAELDAEGVSATVEEGPGLFPNMIARFPSPVVLAGNGGTISARSYDGIAFDGSMTAAGAGPGATGGALFMQLDPQNLNAFNNIPADYYVPEQILISQNFVAVQTLTGLMPGQVDPTTYGIARISEQQLTAGGFDALRLYAQDDVAFDGSVDLTLGRSITIESPIIGESQPTSLASITNVLSAPYVNLVGLAPEQFGANADNDALTVNGLLADLNPAAPNPFSTLTIQADLIDFSNNLFFGGVRPVGAPLPSNGQTFAVVDASAYGFGQVDIDSSGDVRFDGFVGGGESHIASSGNVTIQGAQLYPVTGASASIYAGDNVATTGGYNELYGGTLTILGLPGDIPAAPYSVGGTLALIADTIDQDGIVRAPEGEIAFGPSTPTGVRLDQNASDVTDNVVLGAQSVTSVSLYGQDIPYGGTVDGVNYLYNGNPVGTFNPAVQVYTASFTADQGSVIDLRGGGTLSGAGFIPGRGGSVDVNTTPLLNSSSGTVAANTADQVFAIVKGYTSGYAPVAPGDSGYATPAPGEQITIAAGEIPGLPAGTYTLLPAYYDLLPGGYRVELTTSPQPAGTTSPFGNFTTVAAVTVGYYGTSDQGSVPVAALITSGADVRNLSQYDEETYNQFEINSAGIFGSPRPLLPQDAKTLIISLNPTSSEGTSATGTLAANPITLDAGTLLDAPASGGYGATAEIVASNPLEIVAPGQMATPLDIGGTLVAAFGVQDTVLDALDLPRLVLGGTLTFLAAQPNIPVLIGQTPDVIVEPGADLTAADIMFTTSYGGTIGVSSGATVSTLGQGTPGYGLAQGYFFSSDYAGSAFQVLSLSNGQIVFTPNNFSTAGLIAIASGATLQAGGSLDFVSPDGANVQIGQATLQAADVSVQVANINIGSAATLANFASLLPTGLTLDDATLNTLAQGAQQLLLTATQEVNMLGSVALDSGSTDLVLNTPVIYGYGITSTGGQSDAGTVTITAPNFTWGGVQTYFYTSDGSGSLTVSATPGGQLEGSVTGSSASYTLTDASSLEVNAGTTVLLGYGPDTQANDQVQLDRLAVGFANVTLSAGQEISANSQNSLAVYQDQAETGQPGTGGNLTLVAPLITADSGAVLQLTAGGSFTATAPGTPAATGPVSTLGATIDVTANTIDTSTSFALPAGAIGLTATGDINLNAGTTLDVGGRATPIFDQTAYTNAGTVSLLSQTGNITEAAGATITATAPNATAGSVIVSSVEGTSALEGSLAGGTFSVITDALGSSGSLSAFDALNAALDAGGFTDSRSFELETGDLTVDTAVTAHTVQITLDAGNLDIAATINASGTTPGSIALTASGNVTLEAGAVLDASASKTAVDGYGEEIDAENRAHVTLTTSAGTITLMPGATINVSYPDANNPQGLVVLNAPRVGSNSVAVSAPGSLTIIGAQAIDLFAFATFSPTDANGTIVQDNGTGLTTGSYSVISSTGTLGLDQLGLNNTVYMRAVDNNAQALETQLRGLTNYGTLFNLAPGDIIDSSKAGSYGGGTLTGNLTISGDLDLSQGYFRYSDPAGFGRQTTGQDGSGEPGSIVFRASNDLTVNGSVSDGFAKPPDETSGTTLSGDVDGWTYLDTGGKNGAGGGYEPTNADVLLPSSVTASITVKGVTYTTNEIELVGNLYDTGTTFDTQRPISLNYAIVVNPANLNANVVIPFTVTVGSQSSPIPAGGWVATSTITYTRNGVTQTITRGSLIPAGFEFEPGDVIAAGAVLPVEVQTGVEAGYAGQLVPANTSLQVFADATVSLAQNTGILPVNAIIPSNTAVYAAGVFQVGSTTETQSVSSIEYRSTQDIGGNMVQGYFYPLAQMLPPGMQSWDMAFVSGANLASANIDTVQSAAALYGSVFASPALVTYEAPGSLLLDDQHYLVPEESGANKQAVPAFSVIRTGTGSLELIAGGDIDQSSLYGIYTAGTQDLLAKGENAQFNSPREPYGKDGNLLPGDTAVSQLISSTYQAYYPNGGGDVLLAAGGNVTGDIFSPTANNGGGGSGTTASDAIGNWLWRQGIAYDQNGVTIDQPTAWWINFGTLADPLAANGQPTPGSGYVPQLTGFQGIGALGGGNVTVTIGGNAGQQTARDEGDGGSASLFGDVNTDRGEGLIIVVGSTGRVLPGTTTPIMTGGGTLTLSVGGVINPIDSTGYGLDSDEPAVNGDVIDLRGDINISAGAIGRISYEYNLGANNVYDPRAVDPFTADNGLGDNGIDIAPGDSQVTVDTLRDLVILDVTDPGRVALQSVTDIDALLKKNHLRGSDSVGGYSGFTLWQAVGLNGETTNTSVSLFAAGGNVTPTLIPRESVDDTIQNFDPTDYRSIYPPTLLVTAPSGDIIYGFPGTTADSSNPSLYYSLETMPSATGQVAFLAGRSIWANDYIIDISGANPADLASITDPAFATDLGVASGITNIRSGLATNQTPLAIFAFQPDTPTTNLHADDPYPALFYAADGDIVNFQTGQTLSFLPQLGETLPEWYIAAKPVWIEASGDIVSTGNRPGAYASSGIFGVQENQVEDLAYSTLSNGNDQYIFSSGNLFLNNTPNSVSIISAGEDILSAFAYVAGPGLLDVTAGRNLYQASAFEGSAPVLYFGSFKSLGDNVIVGSPISSSAGAGIDVLAGVGAAGPDYTAFADLYFNPANQANLSLPITAPANQGKVQQVYITQLVAWLAQNFGYTGGESDALTTFLALPVADQAIFVRQVFFDELQASGAQYNDPGSRFYKSYVRGRQAIDTLFPSTGTETVPGAPAGYTGGITMYSGTLPGLYTSSNDQTLAVFDGGVATLFGGTVQVLDPGGNVEFGIPGGPAPGNSSGIVTYGTGDVDIYALGNVELGQSRVFTTGGGNILIWSSLGNINAGIGAKTTIIYNPPVLVYDDLGDVTDEPPANTSGAGIATLQPLPTTPVGDISLIAPVGVIDAGEAGIRSTGNINLAARTVVNAQAIQGGSVTGAPTVTVASLGASEASSAAAGASTSAGQSQVQRNASDQEAASVLEVEVVSIGGSYDEDEKRRRKVAQ